MNMIIHSFSSNSASSVPQEVSNDSVTEGEEEEIKRDRENPFVFFRVGRKIRPADAEAQVRGY